MIYRFSTALIPSVAFMSVSLYYSGALAYIGHHVVDAIYPAITDTSKNLTTRSSFTPVTINVSFLIFCLLNGLLLFWLIAARQFNILSAALITLCTLMLISTSVQFWPGEVPFRAVTLGLLNLTTAIFASIWLTIVYSLRRIDRWEILILGFCTTIVFFLGFSLPAYYGMLAILFELDVLPGAFSHAEYWSSLLFGVLGIFFSYLALSNSEGRTTTHPR